MMGKRLTGLTAALFIAAASSGAAEAKTLVYCSEGSPVSFNPAIVPSTTSFDAARPIFNQLIQFERGSTNLVPGLAESWDVSADGTVITFKLRKGVKFHASKIFTPTRDFDADDVLFSFNRQWREDHPYHRVSGAAYDYFNDMAMGKLLKSIEKIDDATVRFTLNHPEAPVMSDLAMDFATIMSAEYADQMLKAGSPEKIDQEPIGTGPFSFVSYQKDAVIRYKAFSDYWGGKPAIEDLVYAITKDSTTRYAKLKRNECQVMSYPNPADLAAMKNDPDVTLLSQPGLNIGFLAFNTTKKPFDDKRVRQAVNYAVDKAAIIRDVYQGSGQAAINPIPPTIWSYDETIKDYPYDPARAKSLLQEAGLGNGFDTDLWWMPVQRPYNPNAKRIAEMMQADLAKVGVKATLVSYEWGEYMKRMHDGQHMMGEVGWTSDNGDPDNILFLLSCAAARPGGQNNAKWCNKDFDEILAKAKVSSDKEERIKLYRQAQVMFKEEAPWLTIAHALILEPVRKEVVGYKVSPFGRHEFTGVDLK